MTEQEHRNAIAQANRSHDESLEFVEQYQRQARDARKALWQAKSDHALSHLDEFGIKIGDMIEYNDRRWTIEKVKEYNTFPHDEKMLTASVRSGKYDTVAHMKIEADGARNYKVVKA